MSKQGQDCEHWEAPELLAYVLGPSYQHNQALMGFFFGSPGMLSAQTEVQQLLFMREASNGDPVYHRCIARLKIIFDTYVENATHVAPVVAKPAKTAKSAKKAAVKAGKKTAKKPTPAGKPAPTVADDLAVKAIAVGGYASQMLASVRRMQGIPAPSRDVNDLSGIAESEALPLVEELWGYDFDFELKAAFRGAPPAPESCRKRAAELLAQKRAQAAGLPRALAILDRLDAEFAENCREYVPRLIRGGQMRDMRGSRNAP